jgi:hypothetical protein
MAITGYALRVNMTPGSASQLSVTATATSTASALALPAARYWIVSDVDTYVRFGTAALMTAPTTANSIWMPASTPHVLDHPTGTIFVKVLRKGSTSGKAAFLKVA